MKRRFAFGFALLVLGLPAAASAQKADKPDKGKGNGKPDTEVSPPVDGGDEGGVEQQSLQSSSFLGGGFGGGASQAGSISPPAENWTISGGNVDLRTGSYVYSQADLAVRDLSLTRTVGSGIYGKHDPFGSFAHNWEIFRTGYTHASGNPMDPQYEQRVSVWIGGRAETFKQVSSGGSYYLQNISNGSGASIDSNGVYTEADGTRFTFGTGILDGCTSPQSSNSTCSYVSKIERTDGTVINLTYDTGPSGYTNKARLRRVASNRGSAILIEYGSNNANNVITKACIYNLVSASAPTSNICNASAHQTTTYTYSYLNNRVRMASAIDASGQVWQFNHTMSGSNVIQKFKRPGESAYWLTNTIADERTPEFREAGKVVQQDFADGSSFSYIYMLTPQFVHGDAIEPKQIVGGSYNNGAGAYWNAGHDYPPVPLQNLGGPGGTTLPMSLQGYKYQVTPGPVTVTSANGKAITNNYCDRLALLTYPTECFLGPLQKQTDPEGNYREYWWYQSPKRLARVEHHPKPGSSDPVRVEIAEYGCTGPACRTNPTRITDPNGSVTDYTYSTVHGGTLTKTLPAGDDGIRPQTRYFYTQRYAWVKSGGSYVQASSPVWLLTSEEFCRTTAASGNGCTGGASDEVVTAYDYGPNSGPNDLSLRGVAVTADGQTLRSCYTYDALGRKISETAPMANLASCS